METTLIVLLLAVVVWAVAMIVMGIRQGSVLGGVFWSRRVGAAVTAVALIPVLLFFLGEQAGAKAELEALGITPHPALGASSGAA
ncbi:MAG: hypothetical protein ACOC8B_01015, partial [Gemmatimonadota bacterium]